MTLSSEGLDQDEGLETSGWVPTTMDAFAQLPVWPDFWEHALYGWLLAQFAAAEAFWKGSWRV